MQLENLMKVIRSRRTTRGFVESELTDEQVELLVEAARFAPCAINYQPWEFVVVREPENKRDIVDVWNRVRDEFQTAHPGYRIATKAYLQEAAALVMVLGDPRCDPRMGLQDVIRSPDPRDYSWREYMFLLGIGASIENLLLTATAMGFGGGWLTTDIMGMEDEMKRVLGVPEPIRLVSMVAIGIPGRKFPMPFKRDVEKLLHLEHYDAGRLRSDEDVVRECKPGATRSR